MGYEDFTTFTEVDIAADRIQKTANHIDHFSKRNEETYLYKDYGVAHFGDFTHKIKVQAIDANASAIGYCYHLSNVIDDIYNTALSIGLFFYGATSHIYLREQYGGSPYQDDYNATGGVWYYIKIVKSGTSLDAYIYSDSNYSTLLDTLTLTLHANHTLRYLYPCSSYNDGATYIKNIDVENFDIGEVASYVPHPHLSSRDGGIGAHLQGGIGR
jgi:hypothetical protein